ncbi:Cysteine-rich secretory protein LCCL domain-containing 2 [Goodea atripinnis]|uniref:Cysteine-rich secretory protein LCCL domain-containing 2 n=1 Tax=Goodea atripinnis TaxID=208336 RepID=A0ABV0NXK7_9TELE
MTHSASSCLLFLSLLVSCVTDSSSLFLPDSKELRNLLSRYEQEGDQNGISSTAGNRTRRAILWSDREEILQLHNKLRGSVYPTASNMEYMVWDDELEQSATHWSEECQWDHGPQDLLMSIGQNLAVHWGRYRSPAFHVQAWYDEVKDYTYPYPQECNPRCPDRCSGPMCTHYTQVGG